MTLGTNPNYEVSTTNSTLTITKKSATITPNDASKTYGASDPELTATVTGTVGTDTLDYTLVRQEGENVGTYDITVTLGTNDNYEVSTGTATFTITSASECAKPSNTEVSVTYSGVEQTNGYTTPDHVTMTGSNSGTNAGTYKATYTPDENYTWTDGTSTPITVTLTINKATATISADDKSKTYGASDPTLTASVTGNVNIVCSNIFSLSS